MLPWFCCWCFSCCCYHSLLLLTTQQKLQFRNSISSKICVCYSFSPLQSNCFQFFSYILHCLSWLFAKISATTQKQKKTTKNNYNCQLIRFIIVFGKMFKNRREINASLGKWQSFYNKCAIITKLKILLEIQQNILNMALICRSKTGSPAAFHYKS